MSLKSEQDEIEEILFRLLDNLSMTITSHVGRAGAPLRRQIGRVHADYMKLLANDGFAIALLTCFKLAEDAKVGLVRLANVRQQLFKEKPIGLISISLVMTAIIYCLATESRLVLGIEFVSREDVETMMLKMKAAFDTARDMSADLFDSATYQTLTYLAGSLTNYLATKARPLPRMVRFTVAKNYPSLRLSHKLYYVSDRAEELAAENKTIHPLFMQRDLRGLNR